MRTFTELSATLIFLSSFLGLSQVSICESRSAPNLRACLAAQEAKNEQALLGGLSLQENMNLQLITTSTFSSCRRHCASDYLAATGRKRPPMRFTSCPRARSSKLKLRPMFLICVGIIPELFVITYCCEIRPVLIVCKAKSSGAPFLWKTT